MKKVKLFESFLSEANKGKVHKAAKQGSYPAVIVVVQDGKVIHQEAVSTPQVAPATFNVMQEKYPKALIHLEDKTGKRLFSESVDTNEEYDGVISDFKYEFPIKFEEETGNSSKAIKKIAKKGKGYEVRTSTYMSQAEMEKVGLALGLKLKSYVKDSRISISIYESLVIEKREDVGKYNTVKKVINKLGRRPSEQDLATFINNNYYDVTEVERGDDDPQANDKIADLVGFYKFDIDDWEIAWADAQNESIVTEAKDNLYLQLHKKYAEQIKGLKAGKIKKLTDLVSVQRWSMEDREDYFDMDSKKKKELSAEYNEERKLFKKYIAGDESVMLPKGTEALAESLGLTEGIYAKQSKIQPGEYIQTQFGYFYKRVEGQVGGQDAYVQIKKGKEGKKKTSIHDTVDFNIVDKSIALDESLVTEASEDRMIKQIERALKDGTSIFKLPMATQKYYNKNKSDFESVVTEAKKLTIKDVEKAWDSIYGEDFKDEYSGVHGEIMRKYKGKITKAELHVLWYNKYGEDLKDDHGGFFDSLDENLNESVVTEAKYTKKSLLKAMTQDDGDITTTDGKEYVVYKYAYNRRLNNTIWQDDVVMALDQDGEEWEIKYSDIASYNESTVTEGKIKYSKGKTYQSDDHWTVYVDSNSSGFDIGVNHSAGWRLDPHDKREETFELLDNGRQRATIYFKSGNIDKFAQQMFDLNDRTTDGNQTKLTAKDYADIIRVWINMKMANESTVTESLFSFKTDNVEQLHFETDPKTAELMKMELGKSQGAFGKKNQIEDAEYSLRRFRKSINYGNGKDVGVFLPGSYDASVSKLGDGPHKKAVKAVKWNQKKYDQWLEDMAANGGAENAFDMAQNAKNETGLIDWVKKNFRGDDPLQRIQWDIEGYAESVVTEAVELVHVYGEDGKMFGTGELVKTKGKKSLIRWDGSKEEWIDSKLVKLVESFKKFKDHIANINDGAGSTAEVYFNKGKGYYVVVSGEYDYDFDAKDKKELLKKLKDNEFTNEPFEGSI
jgi:hypothetical protein